MAAVAKPDSPRVYVIPPIIFLLCLVGGIVIEALHSSSIPLVPWLTRLASGIAVAAAGFAFMGWGHGRFKSLGVNVKTFLPASRLVTEGAYRYSRNPMYVGFVSILAGIGWAAGSHPMLVSSVAMFLYLNWYVIPREEAYLTREFGDDYKTYCRRVRRWL